VRSDGGVQRRRIDAGIDRRRHGARTVCRCDGGHPACTDAGNPGAGHRRAIPHARSHSRHATVL